MSQSVASVFKQSRAMLDNTGAVRIGWIVELTADNGILIDCPGNTLGPIRARSVLTLSPREAAAYLPHAPVLLVFADNDPAAPIIIGLVHDRILDHSSNEPAKVIAEEVKDVYLDGERLTFDARKEIVLRCGKGSITLRKDGKIVVKGTELISRASRVNKIKGSAVNIN